MKIYAAVRVVDCETTGLEPDAKLVELGWCDVYATAQDDKGPWRWVVEADHHSVLVNPGIPIPPEAMAAHHITDAEVEIGHTFEEAVASFLSPHSLPPGCGGIDAFAAHNAKYDRQYLPTHIGPLICTMRCWQHVDPDAPGFGNQTLRYHLKPRDLDPKKAIPPHRAGPDAYVTAHLLRDLLNRSKPNGERNTVERLVKATERIPLLKICPMGDSWRGKPFEALDTKALRWLATKPDGEEIRATALHWLNESGERV